MAKHPRRRARKLVIHSHARKFACGRFFSLGARNSFRKAVRHYDKRGKPNSFKKAWCFFFASLISASVLDWQELPTIIGCHICKEMLGGYTHPESEWPKLQDGMLDALIRLDIALRQPTQELKI